jgi:hypothetical protein
VQGRSFRPDETAGAAIAVVAESAAPFWPAENPIGKRIDVNVRGRSTTLIVIGVARDAIRGAVRLPERAAVYRPLDMAAESHLILLARSTRAKEIARHVADAVRLRDAVTPVDVRFPETWRTSCRPKP